MRQAPYVTAAFVLLLLYPPLQVVIRQLAPTYAWVIAALFVIHMFTVARAMELEQRVRSWPLFDKLLLLGMLGLMCVAAVRAPNLGIGVGHLAQVIGALMICWVVTYGSRFLPAPATLWPLVLSIAIAAVLLVMAIRYWPTAHTLIGKRDYITDTNRAAVLLALLCPYLMYHAWHGAGRVRLLALAALALSIWSIFASFSESAKLALLVSVLAFALALVNSRLAVWLVAGATIAYIVLAPWISIYGPVLVPSSVVGMTESSTGQVRIDMWREFGLLVVAKPWLGWGMEASRFAADFPEVSHLPAVRKKLLDLWHVHNAALQVWFELGIGGALLLCIAIWRIALRIAALAEAERITAVSLLAGVVAVSLVSHGAWQVWWYCMVALALCFRHIAMVTVPDAAPVMR